MSAPSYISGHSGIDERLHRLLLTQLDDTVGDVGHELFRWAPVAAIIAGDRFIGEAVERLIGPARLDECRHVHTNDSPEPGDWHVDDYCGEPWPDDARHVIVCYFPQDTPANMGPTAVRANGAQYVAAGRAGTFVAMRHDVEHRATGNRSGQQRVMIKYLYRSTP